MKSFSLLFVFCLLTLPIYAQRDINHFNAPLLNGIALDSGWMWTPTSSTVLPDTNDKSTSWQSINPRKDLYELVQIRHAEMGWLVNTLHIDSSLALKPLGLVLFQTGALEIYLNGELIHRIGVIGDTPSQEITYSSNGWVYPIVFKKLGKNELAVRFSFSKENKRLTNLRNFGNPLFLATINDLASSVKSYNTSKRKYALLDTLKVGLFFVLGIVHLLLFFNFNANRSNLYFGLNGITSAFVFYFNNLLIYPDSYNNLAGYRICVVIFIVLHLTATLLATYQYLQSKKEIAFYLSVVLIFLGFPVFYYNYELGWLYSLLFSQFFVSIEIFRICIKDLIKGNREVLFLMSGYLIYLVTFTLIVTWGMGLFYIPHWMEDLLANLGILSIPLGYTILLGRDFGRSQKLIKQKLIENESLFNRNLAVEQETQNLLAHQNESLESQVNERTSELKLSLKQLKDTQSQLVETEKAAATLRVKHAISHDLHDEVGSTLTSIQLLSDMALKFADDQPELFKNHIEKLKQQTMMVQARIRDIVWASKAENISIHHLEEKLKEIANHILEHAGISYKFVSNTSNKDNIQFSSEICKNVLMIYREALNNIIKHADAKNVTISHHISENEYWVTVSDNGNGKINEQTVGSGLYIMKSRAASIGANLVASSEAGEGSTIRLVIPLELSELT